MPIDCRLDYLRTFTRDALADAQDDRAVAEAIIAKLVGQDVKLDPNVDSVAFSGLFGKEAEHVKVVLDTLQALKRPSAPPPARLTRQAMPVKPSWAALAAAPRIETAPPLRMRGPATPGAELLCARSRQVPHHAMLGNDGRLYERDIPRGMAQARCVTDDHTMTAAINAWREYPKDPETRVDKMRQAVECPIAMEVPHQPVMAADGFTYDALSIVRHLRTSGMNARSPVTNEPLLHRRLVPSANVARLIATHNLAETGAAPSPAQYCYLGHRRLGIFAILPKGGLHCSTFTAVHGVLDALYAKAPMHDTNAADTREIALQGHYLLAHVFQSVTNDEVRRTAWRLRTELHVLTEQWNEALKDLAQVAAPWEAFDYARCIMALQGLGNHRAATQCMRQATAEGHFPRLSDTPESCAILGTFLRRKKHWALAEQVLQCAPEKSTAVERCRAKTMRAMQWRFWVHSTPMTEAEINAALPKL